MTDAMEKKIKKQEEDLCIFDNFRPAALATDITVHVALCKLLMSLRSANLNPALFSITHDAAFLLRILIKKCFADLQVLDPQQVEDHGVREPELALQLSGAPSQQLLQLTLLVDIIPAGDDDCSNGVQTPPACPARHLGVFARQQGPAMSGQLHYQQQCVPSAAAAV